MSKGENKPAEVYAAWDGVLSAPIEIKGQAIKKLELQEPTGAQIVSLYEDFPEDSSMLALRVRMAASLYGVEDDDIKRLKSRDFKKALQAGEYFFAIPG